MFWYSCILYSNLVREKSFKAAPVPSLNILSTAKLRQRLQSTLRRWAGIPQAGREREGHDQFGGVGLLELRQGPEWGSPPACSSLYGGIARQ